LKRRISEKTGTKGTSHREKIIEEIQNRETTGDVLEIPLSPEVSEQEEPQELGSQRLEMLDKLEQEMLDDVAVSSSDIQDSDDFENFTIKQTDKKRYNNLELQGKPKKNKYGQSYETTNSFSRSILPNEVCDKCTLDSVNGKSSFRPRALFWERL